MLRKYIEGMYKGLCDIYEYLPYTRENGSTELRETLVAEGQPCRLSFTTRLSYSGLKSSLSRENVLAAAPVQQIKLFLSPDISIKPGSKITVTQNGITQAYKNSGAPAVYKDHQEIVLERFEKWA